MSSGIADGGLFSDFKKFLFRGNVVDLAVAVVIGTAFAALVKALVSDLLTPIIALIFGKPNFGELSFTINGSHFLYGDFLNALIAFLSIAAAVFFLVVAPVNALLARRAKEDPDEQECPECTSAIPVKARRCPMCTSYISPSPEAAPESATGLGRYAAREPWSHRVRTAAFAVRHGGDGAPRAGVGGHGARPSPGGPAAPMGAQIYVCDSSRMTEITRPRGRA